MHLNEAVQTVGEALGLGEHEAAIYVHLCVAGPAKAGDLATALRLHRNEVYRNANRLLQRGLVEMTMERPARYAAVSPKSVFEGEIAARLASVEMLKTVRDNVTPLLSQLEVEHTEKARSTYKVVQGRPEIYALRNRMLEEAESSIDWASSIPDAIMAADVGGLLDTLAARVERGVQVRAALRAPPPAWGKLARFADKPNVRLRSLDLEGVVRFFVVDGKELLMWVVNDTSEAAHAKDEVAILTTAPGFVQAEAMFFEQTWVRATPVKFP